MSAAVESSRIVELYVHGTHLCVDEIILTNKAQFKDKNRVTRQDLSRNWLISYVLSMLDNNLKDSEHLLDVHRLVHSGLVSNNVELHSLSERAALSYGHHITFTNVGEARRAVNSHLVMSLLKTAVLGDILEVVTADNKGALHLVRHDKSLKNATTNGHISSEGALLIDVSSLNSGLRRLVAKTNALEVSHSLSKS